jgi:hypothetical protein
MTMIAIKKYTFAQKTHGSVARVRLMFLYLLARLASMVRLRSPTKNGKTDIGDTLVNKNNSRMVAYRHFLHICHFGP